MKTYLRIFSYAPSYSFIFKYFAMAVPGVIFGALNFTLLISLLEVLFQAVPEEITQNLAKPGFEFSLSYPKALFNYYFGKVIVDYGRLASLYFVCGIIVSSVLLSNLFNYTAMCIVNNTRNIIIRNIRNHIFGHLLTLEIGYFSNERKGDLMSRITTDVQEVENTVVNTVKTLFREPVTIVVYFTMLFLISVKLTLFAIFFLPIAGGAVGLISRRLRKQGKTSQAMLGHLTGIIDETLGGLKVVGAFTAGRYILDKFMGYNRDYALLNNSIENRKELASPMSEFLGVLVVSVLLLYGGSLVLSDSGDLRAAEFITYIIIFSQILTPAKQLTKDFSGVQRGLASAERILEIVDVKPKIADKENALKIDTFREKITFKNVSFAYQEKMVLNQVNLEIPKGHTIALVGPSGGGKSTLADLIPRFHDPVGGEVLIDGISLRDCELDSLRKQMGIVTQESVLFNDTIFNNIAFGMPHATEEEVIRAAKIANAHQFIIETEKGYQTNIGDRGTKLSGGQRQRLSIARAVLKNPPILILDEATSALDSESEKLVQDALSKLMQNRTAIVIAHRLSTIQHADQILVVQDGEIREQGTHQELLGREGLYKKLTSMQMV